MASDIDVFLHGEVVATVSRDLVLEFAESVPSGSPILSTRLRGSRRSPIPASTRVLLGSLLPEPGTRSRSSLARVANVEESDVTGILAAKGRDTIGAAVFVPRGEDVPPEGYEPVTKAEVRSRLEDGEYGDHGGSSLPGMQPKTALTLFDGVWHRRRGGGASTHIVKPSPERAPEVIHDEALSSRAAVAVGLRAAVSHVEDFDGLPVLIVPRYDRVVEGRSVRRVHQEDGASAIGITPDDVNAKFQKSLPGSNLLRLGRVLVQANEEADDLVRLLTLNTLLGNTDAHVKNYGFVYDEPGSEPRLAPAYDVSPHASRGSDELALYVNGRTRQSEVTLADVVEEAASWGVRRSTAGRIVTEVRERLVDFLDDLGSHDPSELSLPSFEWVAENVSRLAPPSSSGGTGLAVPTRPTGPLPSVSRCGAPTEGGGRCRNPTTALRCHLHP